MFKVELVAHYVSNTPLNEQILKLLDLLLVDNLHYWVWISVKISNIKCVDSVNDIVKIDIWVAKSGFASFYHSLFEFILSHLLGKTEL